MLFHSNRNDVIDCMRGLSILAVILLHVNILLPFANGQLGQIIPQSIANIFFHSGYYGVIIFFVISGFLITNTSIKRWGNLSSLRISEFYQIRFARIMPCLIGLLIILSMLHLMGVHGFIIKTTSLENALFAAFTFHINWLEAKTGYLPGGWDVLWSLSVEEMFYLFFPMLCLLTRGKFILKMMFVGFIILGPIARCLYADNDIWADHSYLSCMDGIAMGCLAAIFLNRFELTKAMTKFLLIAGILLFTLIFVFRHTTSQLGLTKLGLNVTILELSIGLVLISVNTNFYNVKNRFFKIFSSFGKYSYEIYLTHMLVISLMGNLFLRWGGSVGLVPVWYVVMVIFCGLVGYLVANYFSEPVNQWLRLKRLMVSQVDFLNADKDC